MSQVTAPMVQKFDHVCHVGIYFQKNVCIANSQLPPLEMRRVERLSDAEKRNGRLWSQKAVNASRANPNTRAISTGKSAFIFPGAKVWTNP
jgi:hypothetical protein